jgi:protein-disulfide isomerase
MPRQPVKTAPPPRSGPPVGLIGAVTVALVAVVAIVVYLAVRGSAGLEAAGSANTLPEGGGVVVSDTADVPQVHLYEDFQCPWCGVLERSAGADLDAAAADGRIGLTVTVMSFLDSNLGNDSSTRAANAALCADDQGAFAAYRQQVFANQPEQEGTGWTDDQLVGFAEAAGVADMEAFGSCVESGTHDDYVTDMQERANQDGISGTPRLLIDGEAVTDDEMRALMNQPGALDQVLQERE